MAIEKRIHLYTYRTQKLSFSSSKILGWRRPGKIEHCWNIIKAGAWACFFVWKSLNAKDSLQCSAHFRVRFALQNIFPGARDEKAQDYITKKIKIAKKPCEMQAFLRTLLECYANLRSYKIFLENYCHSLVCFAPQKSNWLLGAPRGGRRMSLLFCLKKLECKR